MLDIDAWRCARMDGGVVEVRLIRTILLQVRQFGTRRPTADPDRANGYTEHDN
jgi:hypothetical protein